MTIKAELIKKFPKPAQVVAGKYACVAIILRGDRLENLEVGYIRRSIQPSDRWSGQVAFPGGKSEPEDTSDLETAKRETREEIGLELENSELVGRLDDIQARKAGHLLDFFIRPFVFHRATNFTTRLDPGEVADFFWVPLKDLRDQSFHVTHEFEFDSLPMKLPAIRMATEPPLWGLTYMMTQELLTKAV